MKTATIIAALAIPRGAMVEHRVPKKLLIEQGAPTAADKRRIQDGIEDMSWVAALKPTTIGVPAFTDEAREYLEIAVLTVTLPPAVKPARLIELIHRAIPYPVVLVAGHGAAVIFSLAHKRRSQGEAGKVVIEDVRQVALNPDTHSSAEAAFLDSIAISKLPASHLLALYQGLIDHMAALEAARITGVFTPPESAERAALRHDGLATHARLQRELASLRARAHKEKQVNRRVELNLEIKRLEQKLAATKETL